jgi:hypothetical protein
MSISISSVNILEDNKSSGAISIAYKRTIYLLKFNFMNGNEAFRNQVRIAFDVGLKALPREVFEVAVRRAVDLGWYKEVRSSQDVYIDSFKSGLRLGGTCTYLGDGNTQFQITGEIVFNDGEIAMMQVLSTFGEPSNDEELNWVSLFKLDQIITISRNKSKTTDVVPF